MHFCNKLNNFWEVESFTVRAFYFSVQKEKSDIQLTNPIHSET